MKIKVLGQGDSSMGNEEFNIVKCIVVEEGGKPSCVIHPPITQSAERAMERRESAVIIEIADVVMGQRIIGRLRVCGFSVRDIS